MLKVNQLVGFWYSPSDLDFLGGAALILGEAAGMGIDFTYHSDITKQVKIRGTGAYYGSAYGKLTYTSPSVKLCRQADGVWRYANHNLAIQSETFDSASWTKENGAITANAAVAPDGASTGDNYIEAVGSARHSTYRTVLSGAVLAPHVASVFVKPIGSRSWIFLNFTGGADAGCYFNISAGTVGTASANYVGSIVSAGGGWYRCSVVHTLTGGGTYDMAIHGTTADSASLTYTGDGTSGFSLWGAQLKRYPVNDALGFTAATGYLVTTSAIAYDLPFEWDISGNSLGILVEEQRQNLFKGSQTIGINWASISDITVTANAFTAPDGTLTADKLVENNNNAQHYALQFATVTTAVNTWSIFVKSAGRTKCWLNAYDTGNNVTYFDLSAVSVLTNAAGSTASISDAGNGWFRIIVTRTSTTTGGGIQIGPTTTDNVNSYAGDGSSGILAWGAQLEAGAFPTSPIHTVAGIVTRAPDQVSLATSLFPHSDAAGTLVVAAHHPRPTTSLVADGNKVLVTLSNGSNAERHQLNVADNVPNYATVDGNSLQNLDVTLTGIVAANNNYKMAMAYAFNDLAAVFNGGTLDVDPSATMPTCTLLRFADGTGTSGPNGYIRQLTYLARRATNSELQTRTNDGPGASDLLLAEDDGMTFDFLYAADVNRQLRIKDNTTPANNFHGAPRAKLTYTSPSLKLTRQSDGVWRYANHNYQLQSQDFATSWTTTNVTIATNTTSAPDGTSTADTMTCGAGGTDHRITGSVGGIAFATDIAPFALSCWVKKTASNHRYVYIDYFAGSTSYIVAVFDLDGGGSTATQTSTNSGSGGATLLSTSQTSAGNGWYLLKIVGSFPNIAGNWLIGFCGAATGNTILSFGVVSYSGAGTETVHLWGGQVKRYPVSDAGGFTLATGYIATTTAAAYDLPYEWNAALAPQGILIEEQRANIATNSQAISAFGNINVTFTADSSTAPDGTSTADRIADAGGLGAHYAYQAFTGTVAAWTFSVFVKAAGASWVRVAIQDAGATTHGLWVNLSNGAAGTTDGTPTTTTISDAGNGWWRVSVTKTLTAATCYLVIQSAPSDNVSSYSGGGAVSIDSWGAQLELGAFPTSPIHTIGGTVTRVVDNISLPTSLMPISSTIGPGSAIIYGTYFSIDSAKVAWTISNGTTAEELQAYRNGANVETFVRDGGALQAYFNVGLGTIVPNVAWKTALAWAVNDVATAHNGGTVQDTEVTPGVATMPTVTTLYLGQDPGAGVVGMNGYIKQFTYLKRRATNIELQSKTT